MCGWLEEIGLGQYGLLACHWVTSGETLLSATLQDLEKVRRRPPRSPLSPSGSVLPVGSLFPVCPSARGLATAVLCSSTCVLVSLFNPVGLSASDLLPLCPSHHNRWQFISGSGVTGRYPKTSVSVCCSFTV